MKLIISMILVLAAPLAWSYSVQCDGMDSRTGAPVNGTCNDGSFTGFNERSGSFVSGSCEAGGSFEGYDSLNDDFSTGNCDPDPDPGPHPPPAN